jgi:excinuclease ABC subunit A
MLEEIRIKRAAQHNLKHIDVALPRNKLIVVTGPSGSGKSSLAFDTIFAEGQRRYIECLSAYARQFIDQMEKPDVESVEGISPSISIDQKTISTNPRSTVGTTTEVYDLFRLLFARVGTPHCPSCGRVVSSQTPEEILKRIMEGAPGEKVRVLAPVVKGRKGEYQRLFERLRKKGFLRARVNGVLRDLEDDIPLEKNRKHTIEVLVDTAKVGPDSERRLREAVGKALEVSEGEVLVVNEAGRERFFSLSLLCPYCEVSLAELEPRNFSFNSPYGACPKCHGLGYETAHNEWGEVELTDAVCPDCGGARLRKESLSVRVGGRNIHEVGELPIENLLREIKAVKVPPADEVVASRILKEISSRLRVMGELGMS